MVPPPAVVVTYVDVPIPPASSKAIRVVTAFKGQISTFIMEEHETIHELKQRIVDDMRCDFPAEDVTLFWAKRKDREWLKTRDGDYQLPRPGGIPDEAWEVLDNADNVLDPQAMVSEERFGFRGVNDLRRFEIHVLALLPEHRELSKGLQQDARASKFGVGWARLAWERLLTSSNAVFGNAQTVLGMHRDDFIDM
ncbi:hypothetical protein PHYSODRAFT_337499 [Phytophthora sojae]|uniref:Uncharacterized protein n=1 Tax=Phytophthora sojae (strain P6497) TaxID=1094619 RepID=G5A1C5_PHYSP|nr:hypothetical protein PHYSODRAFT_337499 [Phytophthora sojae]EGZ10724.1 hypothetical protein PHYSODRAFT_337499 [Phytophthora sojae]|eukprot:XP_009533469.1 hypothetical protein PHYSODRAFT_337499 [Phytophthora sojae]